MRRCKLLSLLMLFGLIACKIPQEAQKTVEVTYPVKTPSVVMKQEKTQVAPPFLQRPTQEPQKVAVTITEKAIRIRKNPSDFKTTLVVGSDTSLLISTGDSFYIIDCEGNTRAYKRMVDAPLYAICLCDDKFFFGGENTMGYINLNNDTVYLTTDTQTVWQLFCLDNKLYANIADTLWIWNTDKYLKIPELVNNVRFAAPFGEAIFIITYDGFVYSCSKDLASCQKSRKISENYTALFTGAILLREDGKYIMLTPDGERLLSDSELLIPLCKRLFNGIITRETILLEEVSND